MRPGSILGSTPANIVPTATPSPETALLQEDDGLLLQEDGSTILNEDSV